MTRENQYERSWMCAVTFAEAGEWEAARSMAPLPVKSRWAEWFERISMAAAYAEEGLHDEARRLACRECGQVKRMGNFLESIGLRNVRMAYGILQEEAAW